MTETNVFHLSQPGTFTDPLTEVLRNGARALLAQAVEAEVAALLSSHADKVTDDGRHRLVRHGHLPEREIMTGIGPIAVRCPRVRDRAGQGSDRIRFSSAILPPTRADEEPGGADPDLYLKGISTGDFEEALVALLGQDAGGLSASPLAASRTPGRRSTRAGASATCRPNATSTLGRWDLRAGSSRGRRTVPAGDHWRDAEGKKEMVGHGRRTRERAIVEGAALDLKRHGLVIGRISRSQTAPGFWQAMKKSGRRPAPGLLGARDRQCAQQVTEEPQSKAERAIRKSGWQRRRTMRWWLEPRRDWGVKYDKAVECLTKDGEALLAFYDFPAERWKYLRTTNPSKTRSRPSATER